MANENNNINELVADDDDPTVELEIPNFARMSDSALEEDAHTFDASDASNEDTSAGPTVSKLKSDLRLRQKKISKLQYDIDHLRTKWVGLEAEISAREAQTEQLNGELHAAQDTVARKEALLKKRDRKLKLLKGEIRQRDNEYRQLKSQLDELQCSANKSASKPPESTTKSTLFDENIAAELQQKLARSERYADTLRQKSQDLIADNQGYARRVQSLTQLLSDSTQTNKQLYDELHRAVGSIDSLRSELNEVQNLHEQELRTVRFELGAAQDTVVETEDLNSQLASDLIDTRGFKEELERMLGDVEEKSAERIEDLEKEVNKLKRTADRYEQKLTNKSEAISVLLEEIAKRSEQIESPGEIEEVIDDIDERLSEASVGSERLKQSATVGRITRMLIGTVDDQLLRFPLFKDRLTIGRTHDNDIQLKANFVSRRHAIIQTDGDSARITDWGSKNGIQVNSTQVSEHLLSHGDIITIGNARFRYEERKKRES